MMCAPLRSSENSKPKFFTHLSMVANTNTLSLFIFSHVKQLDLKQVLEISQGELKQIGGTCASKRFFSVKICYCTILNEVH